MEQIKGELRPLMVPRDNQNRYPCMRQIKNRLNKRIESFPRNVILVKEIAAMNKEIDLFIQSVLHNDQKIFNNGFGPALEASRVTLKKLGNLISEMGIGRVDELQRDLQKLIKRLLFPYSFVRIGSFSITRPLESLNPFSFTIQTGGGDRAIYWKASL